jgi:hypothetical protein
MQKTLSVILMSICLSSCGVKEEKKPSVTKYFVHGSPELLLEGSTFDRKSFFTEENILRLKNFHINNAALFVERSEATVEKEQTHEDIEEENKADPTDLTLNRSGNDGKVVSLSPTKKEIRYSYIDSTETLLKLNLEKNINNTYDISGVQFGETTYPLEVLHYSINSTETAFSLLLKGRTEVNKTYLYAFYFAKNSTTKSYDTTYVDKEFNYIAGSGVALGWDQTKELNMGYCGKENSKYSEKMTMALNKWQTQLGDNRLLLKNVNRSTYPPFTDINTHCLYVSNTYMTIAAQDSINGGITIPFINYLTGEFISANILIFNGEVNKYDEYGVSSDFKDNLMDEVFTHELGHFLGLDHKGLGNEDATSSIMSYSRDSADLEDYDVQAIQALYPVVR